MNRTSLLDRIADTLTSAAKHPLGVAGLMLVDEVRAGRAVVQPGATAPFEFVAGDWVYPAVVSIDGREVRIIAILAKKPGAGAFRRLIGNIRAAGLRPVVIEPVGATMPAILHRWGWRGRVLGSGIDRFEEWRDPAESGPGVGAISDEGREAHDAP